MKRYGQYCPIARAAEVFAERWTPIIVRNILLGKETFTDILRGAPGLSKTLLTQRLRELERCGIVERRPHPSGRGSVYRPTDAGRELWDVCVTLGNWGARWLDVAPEHLDPGIALWSMCNCLDHERLPPGRTVVRFDFRDLKRGNRFWILIENREGEVCAKPPGFEEDLVVTADSDWFVLWHMGRASWAEAVRGGHIRVDGPRDLARAFPTWNRRSHFAGIKPARPATPLRAAAR